MEKWNEPIFLPSFHSYFHRRLFSNQRKFIIDKIIISTKKYYIFVEIANRTGIVVACMPTNKIDAINFVGWVVREVVEAELSKNSEGGLNVMSFEYHFHLECVIDRL